MPRSKCKRTEKDSHVDFETWIGRSDTIECNVPDINDVKHLVRITNWKRKTIQVDIEGESVNGRALFASGATAWISTINISGNNSKKGQIEDEWMSIKANSFHRGKKETIKTEIKFWNKYGTNRVEETKATTFDINLI